MDLRTLDALKKSIAHWERLRDGSPNDRPTCSQCALCKLFIKDGCIECPVFHKTGNKGCSGTPYWEAWRSYNHLMNMDGTRIAKSWMTLAQEEVDFLKSLLPISDPVGPQTDVTADSVTEAQELPPKS